jgi:hypothetical protein
MYTNSEDTSGKPATDVQDAGGNLPPVSIIAGGEFSLGAIDTEMVINYNNIILPTPSLRKKFSFTTEVIDIICAGEYLADRTIRGPGEDYS